MFIRYAIYGTVRIFFNKYNLYVRGSEHERSLNQPDVAGLNRSKSLFLIPITLLRIVMIFLEHHLGVKSSFDLFASVKEEYIYFCPSYASRNRNILEIVVFKTWFYFYCTLSTFHYNQYRIYLFILCPFSGPFSEDWFSIRLNFWDGFSGKFTQLVFLERDGTFSTLP